MNLISVPSNKGEKLEKFSAIMLPPKPLLIAAPVAEGTFPVVQFQHGFSLKNLYYKQLISQVASHGFIVIAPQMYAFTMGQNATLEISDALEVLSWLPISLSEVLQLNTLSLPDLTNVVLAGHSRGGKVAFGAALVNKEKKIALNISALIGIDPVDGLSNCRQSLPPILTYVNHSFNLPFPTLIVGSGLGSKAKWPLQACVPKKVGPDDFFAESSSPSYHFVALDYGHMDFLDDYVGIVGEAIAFSCTKGPNREDMRRWTGGLMIAFLKSVLLEDGTDFKDVLENNNLAPIRIDPPEQDVFGGFSE